MKYAILKHITAAVLISATPVLATGIALASEAKTEAKTAIPATSEGIWQAIDGHVLDMQAMITTGKMEDIHLHAYAVGDLVRELPGHSLALSDTERAKVAGQGKFIDTLAERLDEAGDGANKNAAASSLGKLEKVLKMIRANYAPRP
ncbi:MAG: hypothetical protein COA84_01785 [Robiginitomaculum sp.]|nr:MAG: hypothetical protein COA84_01785 [Robiginitomaculum sp.]